VLVGSGSSGLGQFQHLDLSDDMLKALVFVRERDWINNAAYRDLTQAHPADATRDLRRLCDLDLLHPEGNTTSRVYKPGAVMIAAIAADVPVSTMHDSGSTMHDNDIAMHDSGRTIYVRATTLHDNNLNSQEGRKLADIPNELQTLLRGLGRRTDPETLQTVIQRLCEWRALSVAELAKLLSRSQTYTRTVVATMVTEGKLEQTKGGQPRHPDQTYRSAATGGSHRPLS